MQVNKFIFILLDRVYPSLPTRLSQQELKTLNVQDPTSKHCIYVHLVYFLENRPSKI